MNRDKYKEIVREFAEKLRDRQFFGAEYITYIFSLNTDDNHLEHELVLEAAEVSFGFNTQNGYPIPIDIGGKLRVSVKKYLTFKYVRGGTRISFKTIQQDYEQTVNKAYPYLEPAQIDYWKDKDIYYCGYMFEKKPLVIFLIFDFNPDVPPAENFNDAGPGDTISEHKKEKHSAQIAEKELLNIYLNPIFRQVEDKHHKKSIFNPEYLQILQNKIDSDLFNPIRESIDDLIQDIDQPHYLQRVYYHFIIENFSIYNQLKPLHQDKLLELAKEFEKNQKNLFRIPNYRDHFLHQFNVYILGIAFISIIHKEFVNNMVENFNKIYYPVKDQEYKSINDVCAIWFLASMFHDIANPVEKCGKWLDAFFQEYIYPSKHGKPLLKTNINIANVIADTEYSNCFEDLAEFHRKLNRNDKDIDYLNIAEESNVYKGCSIRSMILDQTISNRDHGVLSAIMLLHKFRKEKEILRFLFPAAAAISIHNFVWIDEEILKEPCLKCTTFDCEECTRWNEAYDLYFLNWNKSDGTGKVDIGKLRYLSYEDDPLGFLLLLCDSLQDWGRHDVDSPTHAFDPFYNPCELTGLDVKNKEIVFSVKIDIIPGTDKMKDFLLERKRRFIAKIFSRLRFIDGYDFIVRFHLANGQKMKYSMNRFSKKKQKIKEG